MSPPAALAIFAAGLAAGTVNVIVGSGSLITFPTLLALGLPAGAGQCVQHRGTGTRHRERHRGLPPRAARASARGSSASHRVARRRADRRGPAARTPPQRLQGRGPGPDRRRLGADGPPAPDERQAASARTPRDHGGPASLLAACSSPACTAATSAPPRASSSSRCWPSSSTTSSSGSTARRTRWPSLSTRWPAAVRRHHPRLVVGGRADRRRFRHRRPDRRAVGRRLPAPVLRGDRRGGPRRRRGAGGRVALSRRCAAGARRAADRVVG